MPHYKLSIVHSQFSNQITVARDFANAVVFSGSSLSNMRHKEMVLEVCFLQAVIAWEDFLENTFILYLLGKKSPGRFKPIRYVTPKNWEHARDLTVPDAMEYADWLRLDKLQDRASKFFKDGQPFSRLSTRLNFLGEVIKIRNAVAHSGEKARKKMRPIIINHVGIYLTSMTPGALLMHTPNPSIRQKSVYDYFVDGLEDLSNEIVP